MISNVSHFYIRGNKIKNLNPQTKNKGSKPNRRHNFNPLLLEMPSFLLLVKAFPDVLYSTILM